MKAISKIAAVFIAGSLILGTPSVAVADVVDPPETSAIPVAANDVKLPSGVNRVSFVELRPNDSVAVTHSTGGGYIPSPMSRDAINDANYNSGKAATHAALPAKFDLRTSGLVAPVKDQGSFGTCWSFAAMASAESAIMRNEAVSSFTTLSEKHLVNSVYNTYPSTKSFSTTDSLQKGGNDFQAAAALTRWQGARTSAAFPYTDVATPISEADIKTSDFHLKLLFF
ncbi:MAG: hypothetical protein FWG47_06860 [Propionibacteriaceae bacterium]|nr:hypothetical protein [Propionibacteriaceae bacterium]